MTTRWKSPASWIVLSISLAGCGTTVQSTQYNFIKGLFEPNTPALQKNWRATLGGKVHSLFAINHRAGTFFANEDGFIAYFDGWQVMEIRSPDRRDLRNVSVKKLEVMGGGIDLRFESDKGRVLATHKCAAWKRQADDRVSNGWQQDCLSGDKRFHNRIVLNEQGEMIRLRFVFEPEVTPIYIELVK